MWQKGIVSEESTDDELKENFWGNRKNHYKNNYEKEEEEIKEEEEEKYIKKSEAEIFAEKIINEKYYSKKSINWLKKTDYYGGGFTNPVIIKREKKFNKKF